MTEIPDIQPTTADSPFAGEKEPNHKASRKSPFAVNDSASKKRARKERGPVRRLTNADRDKIAMGYTAFALAVMPYKPEVAQVIAQQAEACADAWFKVAEKNTSVRRMLLVFLETGVWGMLIAAHVPIAIAIVPDNVKAMVPKPFNVFSAEQFADEEPEPQQPDGPWDGSGE